MEIINSGIVLQHEYIQQAIIKGIEFSVPPSLFICQWWYESRFGSTNVAKVNNNWGGSSYFYKSPSYLRKSGVTVYRGSPRPKNEGAYYMKFNTINDYLIDYFYLLLEQGIYNIKGKNNFSDSVKGLFKQGGANSNYAIAPWNEYLKTMEGIRFGINKRNNNILDKIDHNPLDYLDGNVEPKPPTDPVDPPIIDPGDPLPSVTVDYYDKHNKEITTELNKIVSSDLFNMDIKGSVFGNSYIKIIKQYDNMYKVEFTNKFGKVFKDINNQGLNNIEEIIQGVIGRPDKEVEDDNIPTPAPDNKKYFIVDYEKDGINYWKKSNWELGQLQYAMSYGYTRDNGTKFHSGYDIGAGGKTDLIAYSVVKSKVEYITNSNTGGYMIQLKHIEDGYYSTYLHLKSNSAMVEVGQVIDGGTPIGIIGNTPISAGYSIHLHYVLSRNGKTSGKENTIDPEKYLGIIDDNKTSLPNPAKKTV